MVAFPKAIIFYLTIPSNATTGTRIVLDGVNGFVLVYNSSNVLIGSISPKNGTDSFGNTVFEGITSYDPGISQVAVQMDNGQIIFEPLGYTATQAPASIAGTNAIGFPSMAPTLVLGSPEASNVPGAITSIQLAGRSFDNTTLEYISMFTATGADVDVRIIGKIRYNVEVWHDVSFAAGWSNNGGGFGNVKYIRNAFGDIELTGLALYSGATTAPLLVFTLPVGYRPNRTVNIAAQTSPSPTVNPTTCTIQVLTTGDVRVTNFSGTFNPSPLSFENVKFNLST